MWSATFKYVFCAFVVCYTCSANPARATFTFDRTSQTSEETSGSWLWGDNPYEVDSSTSESANLVEAGTTASNTFGEDPQFDCDATAMGSCELNTDNQAILGWSFIHDIELASSGTGGEEAGTVTGPESGADQGSTVTADANLVNPQNPTGTTSVRLQVDIGWVSSSSSTNLWRDRTLNVALVIGQSATLAIVEDEDGLLYATGTVNNEQTYTKASSAALDSDIGTLGIGSGEFVNTLAVGDSVNIDAAATSNIYQVDHKFAPAGVNESMGDIFQGSIEIMADN